LLSDLGRSGARLAEQITEPIRNFLPAPNREITQQPIQTIGDFTKRTQIPYVTDNSAVPNFLRGVGDTASMGLSTYLDRMFGQGERADLGTRSTAGNVGQFAGSVLLPAGKVKAGAGLVKNLANAAYAGGILSGLGEVGEELTNRNDQTYGQRIADVGIGAALGAAGGALGHGVSSAFSRLLRRNNIPEKAAQEILALPAPRENVRPTGQAVQTPDVITPEYTFALPEPRVEAPTTARIAQQQNPYRDAFENLMRTAQRLQQEGRFTPGREDLELESLWSQMAGREGVSLDELIQRAYPTRTNKATPGLAERARTRQAAREVAGAPLPVKTLSDRSQPQGVLGNVAAPQTVPARAKGIEVLSPGTQPARPRTEVNTAENISVRRNPEADAEQIVKQVQEPRVRDRVYSFLDEQEKAARQRIAKRRGRLNSTPLPEWGDMAIIGAAKLGKGTIKAADWTEEMVKEFGEKFRPIAQRVYNDSKEHLRQQERKASKEGRDAEAFNNSGLGNADSFERKISRDIGKRKTSFSQKFERLRTQFIDDLAALEGLEKRVKGRVSSAEDSLYKSGRLFKGTPERAAQYVSDRLGPIARKVESTGKSMDDLGRYALAVHARDVNNAGYKSGFTNVEIDDVIKKLGTPELEAARKELIQINKDLLQEQVKAGNVSSELADVLNNRWQNYIPLFRDMNAEDAVSFGGGLSNALANVADPIKKLKGSGRNVIDPMENMVKNIMQSINSAERNKVAIQLAKLAKSDAEEQFIRKLGPDEKVGSKNVVTVREGGEPVKYEVEPDVYKAMLNLDQESSNMLINILSKPASLLRAGATLTPEFALRNPMRDVLQAFVTSKSGFNPITDFTAGLIQTIGKGDLYKKWIDNLGAYGNVMSMDRNVHRQALEKVVKQPVSKKVINVLNGKTMMEVLRYISDTTESATKVGEFRAALRQGQTPQEAAYRSRDLMDFARAGSSVRQANKVVAFLNANIQGKSKLLRALKENPVGTTTRALAAVTVPTVGVYTWNYLKANDAQKQTIDDSPDWLKDSFWLIAVPGTDMVARIPKPFDLAPIFANLPEKALQFTQENDPEAFDGYAKRTLASGALPYQISGLLPIVEGMSNYSFFRQGSIIPQREEGLEYKDQYDPIRTTEAAKLLAAGAQKITGGEGAFKNFSSPRIADNTIKGLTAGLGTYATSAIDAILQGTGLTNRPQAPAKRIEQKPLAKAFLVDPLQGGKSMDSFYNEIDKLSSKKQSAKINDRVFPETDAARLKVLNKISESVSDINKEIRSIEAGELSSKEKRDRISTLTKERNDLVRGVAK
jgi:hypothetical protein